MTDTHRRQQNDDIHGEIVWELCCDWILDGRRLCDNQHWLEVCVDVITIRRSEKTERWQSIHDEPARPCSQWTTDHNHRYTASSSCGRTDSYHSLCKAERFCFMLGTFTEWAHHIIYEMLGYKKVNGSLADWHRKWNIASGRWIGNILLHPSYSPDLALYDFFFFSQAEGTPQGVLLMHLTMRWKQMCVLGYGRRPISSSIGCNNLSNIGICVGPEWWTTLKNKSKRAFLSFRKCTTHVWIFHIIETITSEAKLLI